MYKNGLHFHCKDMYEGPTERGHFGGVKLVLIQSSFFHGFTFTSVGFPTFIR